MSRNQFHLVWFDPGGTIGWAAFSIHKRAFTDPQETILGNLKWWDTGEFTGSEMEQCDKAVALMHRARYGDMPFTVDTEIGSEDFDLVQTLGGKELLSPVRINSILDWECRRLLGLRLILQNRSLRTNVTKPRLKRWGFSWKGKDSFAAMQHGIVRLRRIKQESLRRPWKLDEGS